MISADIVSLDLPLANKAMLPSTGQPSCNNRMNLNVSPNPLGTVYATKRRRRSNKSINKSPHKKEPDGSDAKITPCKRHRQRFNDALDHLASILPFENSIVSKLDKISILRLAVAYLRAKSYIKESQRKEAEILDSHYRRDFITCDNQLLNGEMFLQALNGFLMILDCNGELFFATHSIETYLGFHQSDVVHQSVFELVHSEDREELQRQLVWNSFLTPDQNMPLQEILLPENSHLLERSFTVRFRCLLDNTSGFLRLDIRGKIKPLHGQNRKTEEPLALFCICTPFGPPSLLEAPQKEIMFKSKHKLDLGIVSFEQRGKELFGYNEVEFSSKGIYDLVHPEDLTYVAQAHNELLKTGASGMIAYRLLCKDLSFQYVQTSSRLVYKNSKPDFIVSTHRPLTEEEGKDLLSKRTMDFKVSYLDAGLSTTYFDSGDCSSTGTSSGPKLNPRRYKTQLRDFLSSCRTKRKANDIYAESSSFPGYPSPAATAYMTSGTLTGYPATDTATLYMQQTANIAAAPAAAAYQTLYPGVDNRYLAATTDYFAGYRTALAGTYYPTEYHAALGNGYLDVSTAGSRISSLASYDQKLSEADKLYSSTYMSDPRLCHTTALRLGAATPDNKHDVWSGRGSHH